MIRSWQVERVLVARKASGRRWWYNGPLLSRGTASAVLLNRSTAVDFFDESSDNQVPVETPSLLNLRHLLRIESISVRNFVMLARCCSTTVIRTFHVLYDFV